MEAGSWIVFLGASLVLLLTPGPAVVFIIARSLEHGRSAGVVSALGLGIGNLVHVVGVTLGLSALLLASSTLYTAVKLLGAAYLVYLGVRKILAKSEPDGAPSAPRRTALGTLFFQGIVVNTLNPKVALFFVSFLPQFADVSRGHVTAQLALLGVAFVALGVVTDVLYAVVVASARPWLARRRPLARSGRWVGGGVYIGLGVAAAASGRGAR